MVSEKMGYKVDYSMENGQKVKVTIKSQDKAIELKTGESSALVNGKQVDFNSSAVFSEGRTFVPVRFISESFGVNVQWDHNNYIAIVDQDGKYHAPAWYKPAPIQLSSLYNAIVENAKKYQGVPYKYGGTTPSGFDCSGFLQYLYRQQGISLPRTADSMYNGAGRFVSEVQVGDLVFFSDRHAAPATHVGIYIGNNQFISATSSSGVRIDSLFTGYWGSRYIAAKRIG